MSEGVRSQPALVGPDWMGLYRYSSPGRRYYRLQWGTGRKVVGQLHVAGGDVSSPIVQARAQAIQAAIAQGADLQDIQALVRGFGGGRRRRKGTERKSY